MPTAEATPHMLIVEDEEALCKSMARILKSRGLEADTAFSGAEARQRLAANEYAVVVLDVRLPDESGYGLLGELRALKPDIAVVMISGVDDPELGKAAVEHGAHGYFVKPIGSTELYLAVVNAIRRRGLWAGRTRAPPPRARAGVPGQPTAAGDDGGRARGADAERCPCARGDASAI